MSDTPMIDRVLKDGSIAERNIRYTVALQRIVKLGGPGAAIAYEALNPLERHPVTGKGLSSTPSGEVGNRCRVCGQEDCPRDHGP